MGKFKKLEQGKEPIEVGSWLLNPAVGPETVGREQTLYIDMDRIRPNDQNSFSKKEIEELAQMIKMAGGIWQNLIVKPMDADGFFTLTTGERRWRAAQLLKEMGEYPEKLGNKVPCSIKDPNQLELPISEKSKEMFSILVTNKYRNKTDGDRLMEIREWRKIYEELREKGVKVLYADGTYSSEEEDLQSEDVEQRGTQIQGVKTRELIANAMNMSTGQISRFEKVEKNADKSVLDKLVTSDITLGEAEQLIGLPKETQSEMIREKEKTGEFPVEEVKKEKEKRVSKVTLSKERVESDIHELIENIPDVGIMLSDEQYKKFQKCIQQLKKILEDE